MLVVYLVFKIGFFVFMVIRFCIMEVCLVVLEKFVLENCCVVFLFIFVMLIINLMGIGLMMLVLLVFLIELIEFLVGEVVCWGGVFSFVYVLM